MTWMAENLHSPWAAPRQTMEFQHLLNDVTKTFSFPAEPVVTKGVALCFSSLEDIWWFVLRAGHNLLSAFQRYKTSDGCVLPVHFGFCSTAVLLWLYRDSKHTHTRSVHRANVTAFSLTSCCGIPSFTQPLLFLWVCFKDDATAVSHGTFDSDGHLRYLCLY